MSDTKDKEKKEEVVEQSGPVFNPPVYIQRYTRVRDLLYKLPGIEKVVDFGCAEGKFIKYLKKLPFLTELSCVDLNIGVLESASIFSRPIAWDYLFKRHEPLDIRIFHGSVLERDSRLQDYSAVTCVELIEHLHLEDLPSLISNIFGFIRPKVAIFTTPNSEFNILFPGLDGFRHWDHKFEWTRSEFRQWYDSVLELYPDYTVRIEGIGEPPPESAHLGFVTQVAIFTLKLPVKPRTDNSNFSEERYTLIDNHHYPGRADDQVSEMT